MGMMNGLLGMLFGGSGNVVRDTVEVFTENAENRAARISTEKAAAMAQYAAEFSHARKGWFDRFIDGLNRLPRPALALGTISLFVSAMYAPEWFGQRMAGVALIPEPLWWLMGAIVSFYFGARHQAKGQDFQRAIVETVALSRGFAAVAQDDVDSVDAAPVSATEAEVAAAPPQAIAAHEVDVTGNAALAEWKSAHGA